MKLNKVCFIRSKQKILNNLSDEWPDQGVVILLGANGAGKSTLLQVLAGITQPGSGEVDKNGLNGCFMMPEPAKFYPSLSVGEQLLFVAKQFHKNYSEQQLKSILSSWQLTDHENKLTKHLSLGYRQRLSLAQLEASDADLLLLDEPMNGMDPAVMQIFQEKVAQWRNNKLVVMATHVMQEVQELADWVVIMERGTILHSAAVESDSDLKELYHKVIKHHSTGTMS